MFICCGYLANRYHASQKSADEARTIAYNILTVSQIPSSPVQVNNASSSANIDSENKNKSRRAQLLSIDGVDDDLVNSIIHIIPSSPTSSGPIDHSRQNEETLQPSFDGKRSATASETQNGIVRLTDSNTTQKSPLSAIKMKIRLQQSGKIIRDVSVRIILTGPKEAPVKIIKM